MSDKKVTEKRKRTPSSKVYNDSFVNNDLVKTPQKKQEENKCVAISSKSNESESEENGLEKQSLIEQLGNEKSNSSLLAFESITRFYYRFDFSERTMIYYNIVFFGYIMVLLICYLIYQQNNLILTGITQNK